jgi:hypothetical protein
MKSIFARPFVKKRNSRNLEKDRESSTGNNNS